MSKICYICSKTKSFGNNVSHSKHSTGRSFGANLLSTKITVNGTPKRVVVCSRCLKTMTKKAVPSRASKKAAKQTA
ncbi:MAG: 50S ribosomal protein L28 [Patescibacteria group bacterium]